jgi:hypothetical protein
VGTNKQISKITRRMKSPKINARQNAASGTELGPGMYEEDWGDLILGFSRDVHLDKARDGLLLTGRTVVGRASCDVTGSGPLRPVQ